MRQSAEYETISSIDRAADYCFAFVVFCLSEFSVAFALRGRSTDNPSPCKKTKKKSTNKLACDLMIFDRLDLILECVESKHKGKSSHKHKT